MKRGEFSFASFFVIYSWNCRLFYYKQRSPNKIASPLGRGVDAVDGEGLMGEM